MRRMEAYVVAAKWRYELLTDVGKLSHLCRLKGEYDHVGIMFKNVKRSDFVRLRPFWREDREAEYTEEVAFDFMASLKARFQKFGGPYYSSAEELDLYKLDESRVNAQKLLKKCIQIAASDPRNTWFYRFDALFGCFPFRAWCLCAPCDAGVEGVAPSTCSALVLRAIAASMQEGSLDDDGVAMRTLGMRRETCSRRFLTAHTPLSAVDHLLSVGLVENMVYGNYPPVYMTMRRI